MIWDDMEAYEQERHDADLLQAQYERESAEVAALHRQGVCTHGWLLGKAADPQFNASREQIARDRQRGEFPDRPTDQSIGRQTDIPTGKALCLDCGQIVDDPFPDNDD